MSSKTKKVSPERRAALTQLCDAETYVAIIRESISEEQAKAHPPIHLANVLALTAELYLLHYDSIGRSFLTANELAVAFTCKLAKDKDNVEIAFLPVAKFKDSASATVEDDFEQPPLGDIAKESKSRPPKQNFAKLGNAPTMGLPAPVVIDAEIVEPTGGVEVIVDPEDAYTMGQTAGFDLEQTEESNPFSPGTVDYEEWKEGFLTERGAD